jgi:PAS domain S-box-containing protein
MIAYLGIPLNFPNNQPFGTLCVLDTKETKFSAANEKLLRQFKNVIELDLALIQSLDWSQQNKDYDIIHRLTEQNEEYLAVNEELKQANDQLFDEKERVAESEKHFRLLVENAPYAIFIQTEGKFSYVNNAAIRLYGANSSSQLLNTTVLNRIHPDFREVVTQRIKTLNEQKQAVSNISYQHLKLDNTPIDVEVSAVPFKFMEKEGALVFVNDISDRNKLHQQLVEHGQNLENIFTNSPLGIFVIDIDKNGNYFINSVNPTHENLTGLKSESVKNKPLDVLSQMYGNETYIYIKDLYDKIVASKKTLSFEEEILLHNKLVQVNTTIKPLINESGVVYRLIGTNIDISQLKETEKELIAAKEKAEDNEKQIKEKNEEYEALNEELREANELLLSAKEEADENHKALLHSHYLMQYIIEHNQSAVAVHDKDLKYLYVSKKYLTDYNVKEKNIIGKHHYEVFPDLPKKWKDIHKKALQGYTSFADDDPYHKEDGTIEWTRWECRPWYEVNGEIGGFIIYTEVITKQKEFELELLEAKEKAEKNEKTIKKKNEEYETLNEELREANEMLLKAKEKAEENEKQIKEKNEEYEALNEELREANEHLSAAKEKSEKSELKYKLFIDQTTEGIYRLDVIPPVKTTLPVEELIDYLYDYAVVTECNLAMAKMYNLSSPKDLMNLKLIDFHGGRDIPTNRNEVEKFILNGFKINDEETIEKDVDGNMHYFSNNSIGIIKDELIHSIWGTQTDITEKKKYEVDLIKAKEKAEESDRLKSAFLQNLSHEIRTPLNSIIGFSERINAPNVTEEKRQFYSDIIVKSGFQLLSIVTDILTISSIDTGQEKVKEDKVCVNSIISETEAVFMQQVIGGEISIKATKGLTDAEAEVLTDSTKLTQILSNLISNAIKFTTEGEVEFGYTLNNNVMEFFVKDNGIGIDISKHDLIFDRFVQADDSTRFEYGGTGLGLSISKGFVELMGGKIWVDSELGKGATFYFTIPYKTITKKQSVSDVPIQMDSWKSQKYSILVAEDEFLNFLYLDEILQSYGFKVVHAPNGKVAVDLCENNGFDLVLMDLKMPVLDGVSAARIIKKQNPNLPIVAQTAYALSESDKFNDLFDDFVVKPITTKHIEKMLLRILT